LIAILAAMGIGRQSLYNAFQDKRAVYLEALERYQRTTTAGTCNVSMKLRLRSPESKRCYYPKGSIERPFLNVAHHQNFSEFFRLSKTRASSGLIESGGFPFSLKPLRNAAR
jgi:hypothetical protein